MSYTDEDYVLKRVGALLEEVEAKRAALIRMREESRGSD